MIFGVGTDIIAIKRIAKFTGSKRSHFAKKVLSEAELNHYSALGDSKHLNYLAGRWAAKEAIAKALGTGLRAGFYMPEITVKNSELGKPIVTFSNKANLQIHSYLNSLSLNNNFCCHLSISHEKEVACAFAVFELI